MRKPLLLSVLAVALSGCLPIVVTPADPSDSGVNAKRVYLAGSEKLGEEVLKACRHSVAVDEAAKVLAVYSADPLSLTLLQITAIARKFCDDLARVSQPLVRTAGTEVIVQYANGISVTAVYQGGAELI